ncbi:sugar transporter SWEET1 [Electrophorus electricus]|uniref:Sugar transporter SWEET1 n=1 Tax=Electrophorus electricus TaxID=8005 RepID=A0A4W4GG45_ELEEL|nr:sugar transporter SWEET1 [Electrophorus electricus]
MDFLQFLSCACVVFTVGMFSTGLTDLMKMRATESADNVQFLPFLTTCLNNLGWLYYGMLKKDSTLMIVNFIGASLQSLYIFTYFRYAKEKRRVLLQTLVLACVLCVAWVYFSMVVPQGDTQLSQLGLACSVFTVSMYLSPLTDLVEIVRTRSVERLSFPLTVATFFTSTSWTLYGLQLQDFYIMVPNTPGIVTSLIRFFLFWHFGAVSRDSLPYRLIQT